MHRKRLPTDETTKDGDPESRFHLKPPIPIVGIGASSGGLDAFGLLFMLIPIDRGIACIPVPHINSNHASMLADILIRVTKMPVLEAQEQGVVMQDHLFIIPPNREMEIFHRKILLSIPGVSPGPQMKVDLFYRSLAEEQGDKAICSRL